MGNVQRVAARWLTKIEKAICSHTAGEFGFYLGGLITGLTFGAAIMGWICQQ